MFGDKIFKYTTAFFAFFIVISFLMLIYELYKGSYLAISKFGLSFIKNTVWDPVNGVFGALPLIIGTIVVSLLSLLFSLPISIGVALVLVLYLPRKISRGLAVLIETMAGVPSVIYGLWGLYVLAPFLRENVYSVLQSMFGFIPLFSGPNYGIGFLTGSMVLALMITPIITAVTKDLLLAVPTSIKEAAVSLGPKKKELALIMIKYIKPGLFAASLLGLGRAIGETMAISMVIGNKFKLFPSSLFDTWYTLSAIIANEFLEATYDLYISSLVYIGLLLLAVTLAVIIIARIIIWRFSKVRGEI
ncbi:MAG: phosphate ABC transporter permease subunit PstC [Desulfurococcales archaeon]|jgi:phosphate transport system permease protein|nr:phosphate ABC transporter permease subunit PstC [Desulfurococcales archaeon]